MGLTTGARTPSNAWIVRPRANPLARARLFCFAYAGGSASAFRTWPASLPRAVEVCAVQLPGREARIGEAAYSRLTDLVPTLADALQPLLGRPFAFFGHSLGAVISFELARWLRAHAGPQPGLMFVAAHGAPQLPNLNPKLHQLPEPMFLQELQRYNGTPSEVLQHPDLVRMLVPVLRADFALFETYAYSAAKPLDCPLVALGGLADHEVSQENLTAWCDQTAALFALHMFRGDHFFPFRTDSDAVLRLISRQLASALLMSSWSRTPP